MSLESPPLYRYGASHQQADHGDAWKVDPGLTAAPASLGPDERSALGREWDVLLKQETAPNHLGRVVLDWAQRHPADPLVPEALHLAVSSTRFGCNDAGTGSYSREAFTLLHRRYPDSRWAKLTKYWYRQA